MRSGGRGSLRLLISGLICVFTTACGKGDPTGDALSLDTDIPSNSFASKDSLSRASRISAYCEQPENCPSATAALAIAWGNGVTLCTGFLITPDRLRAPRSCIPEPYLKGEVPCSNGIYVAFPKTLTAPAVNVKCSKILDPSSPSEWRTIEFAKPLPPSAVPLEVLPTLPESGQILTLYHAQSTGVASTAARIVRSRCRLAETSGYPRSSGVSHLVFCSSVPSARGAPLLDRWGNVRGTVEEAVGETEWADLLRRRPGVYEEESRPASFVNFFACEKGRTPVEPGCSR